MDSRSSLLTAQNLNVWLHIASLGTNSPSITIHCPGKSVSGAPPDQQIPARTPSHPLGLPRYPIMVEYLWFCCMSQHREQISSRLQRTDQFVSVAQPAQDRNSSARSSAPSKSRAGNNFCCVSHLWEQISPATDALREQNSVRNTALREQISLVLPSEPILVGTNPLAPPLRSITCGNKSTGTKPHVNK